MVIRIIIPDYPPGRYLHHADEDRQQIVDAICKQHKVYDTLPAFIGEVYDYAVQKMIRIDPTCDQSINDWIYRQLLRWEGEGFHFYWLMESLFVITPMSQDSGNDPVFEQHHFRWTVWTSALGMFKGWLLN